MVVQYKVEISAATSAAIGSQFWIVNNGNEPVNLNDLTLRYYLTNEVAATLMKTVNWANVGVVGGANAGFPTGNISVEVVPMAMPVASADTYLAFGFTGGTMLSPGSRLQFSWTVQNFMSQSFTQTGDHSFNAAASMQMDWANVVLMYQGQSVVWGIEP
ncbi:cellulose binding domain-containing protein [Polyangium sorediatum]|uniref:Cellulose binding domain-containing protein n=1 Tax=Polyangium sorediatum TaxID=889274 RepID=A0ABT6NK19_9BACT|nr:cellulose binding domain-containing protein [Polyangium sorediatum]MDI1428644.1 cellulose binding domain-containing protein [Polyangium sorediatum]